jgi:lipoate-protein ligase A
MPGGKLVVADFAVRDGKLTRVRISGDFLQGTDYPRTIIDVALEGLSADAGDKHHAGVLRSALGPNVRMYGVSPEAIAVAVQRALESPP